jgi:hypothetical protein
LKKPFLLLLLLLPVCIFAQSRGSLTILSERGDKFYLYLDGKKQNKIACSHIRIRELPDLYYSAKIEFTDTAFLPILKNNLYVSDAEDNMKDAAYRIRYDKAGKPRLFFYEMLPVQPDFKPTEGMYVFDFGKNAAPVIGEKPPKANISTTSLQLGSLTVFSQNGDKFFLYLDGVKQNDEARANVRIQEVPGLYYSVKIIFADKKLSPIIKNNLFISDGEDNLVEATYRIRRDNTGKPKLNFFSIKKAGTDFKKPEGMYVYNFGKPAVAVDAKGDKKEMPLVSAAPSKNKKANTAILQKNDGGNPVSPDVVANKPLDKSKPAHSGVPTNKMAELSKPKPDNGKCNGWPMAKGDFEAAMKTINDAVKEDERLAAAEQAIASACVSVNQVTAFCSLLKSERSRLAFAKYAYKFTTDKKNYTEIIKIFSLESSIAELNMLISKG